MKGVVSLFYVLYTCSSLVAIASITLTATRVINYEDTPIAMIWLLCLYVVNLMANLVHWRLSKKKPAQTTVYGPG